MSAPVAIEVERRFPVTVTAGFDFITDLRNWPDYWPRLVRIDPSSRWGEAGDRAGLSLRLLGREVELEMTLTRIDRYRLVEYTSEQRGLPAARHRRHFDEVEGDLAYRIEVEYEPRPGWRTAFDRLAVRRAIARTAAETMTNLDQHLRAT